MKIFPSLFHPLKTKSWFCRLKYYLKIKLRKFFLKVKTHPYLSGFLLLVFTVLGYLFFSLSRVSASRLELLALKDEIANQTVCHEECRYERQRSREKLALAVKEDKKLLTDIEKYFRLSEVDEQIKPLNESEQLFYEELIKIISQSYGSNNPPDFLIDYLAHPAGDEKIKAVIIRDYLTNMSDPELVDYYFLILNSESGIALKREAIKALSGLTNKEEALQVEQLDMISDILFSGVLSPSLNLDLIFLLSEYYEFYPHETNSVLISLYDYSNDPVIKTIARDILSQFSDNSLAEIEVSAEDWEKYWH